MATLYIMRHGEAHPRAASDAERPLTEQGAAQACMAAQWLVEKPLSKILVSPYLRARQTADLVTQSLACALVPQVVAGITPDDPVTGALHVVATEVAAGDVLIVSHLPLVGLLASQLLYGHHQSPLPFYTASMAAIEFEQFGAGLGNLLWFQHCA
jgi:phosphohistidine phosphatase